MPLALGMAWGHLGGMIALLSRVRCFVPLLATAALACSAPVMSHQPLPAQAAPVQPSSDPALWAISDEDTTLYLFGTVHMLKPDVVWFDDEVKAAFDRSDELVLEVVEEDPAQLAAAIAPLMVNEDAPTSAMLAPDIQPLYFAALKKFSLPVQMMEHAEPWLVAIHLSMEPLKRLGYRDDLGIDKQLQAAAHTEGKKVVGLETTAEQLGFFDDLPRAVKVAYLTSTLKDLPKIEHEFSKLMTNWKHGHPNKLAKQMNESLKETPEMAGPLLYDRNARWVEWIGKRMEQPGTVFLAVGAGHLAGEKSVIDLLTQRHWKVLRLSKADFAAQ